MSAPAKPFAAVMLEFSSDVPAWLFLTVKASVAVACCLAFIPCVLTMIRTTSVHPNCKLLLVASSLSQLLLLATQVAMFAFDYATGNLRPESEANEVFFCIVHQGAYFMSTYLSILLVIERFVAAKTSSSYEKRGVSVQGAVIFGLCGVALAGSFGYVVHWLGLYFAGILTIFVLEMAVIIGSSFVLLYSTRNFKVLPYGVENRLGAKYTLKEVSAFSRAVLPPIILSSLIKALGLGIPTAWKFGYYNYSYASLFFFGTHAINCIVVKGMLIRRHKQFRRTFVQLFCTRKTTVVEQPATSFVAETRINEVARHFAQLNIVWMREKKSEAGSAKVSTPVPAKSDRRTLSPEPSLD